MYPTRYLNPQAVGYLTSEYVKCGKPTCRCRQGQLHGPYTYLHYRAWENGAWRQHKKYVPRRKKDAVARQLALAKRADRSLTSLLAKSGTVRRAVRDYQHGRISGRDLLEIDYELRRSKS